MLGPYWRVFGFVFANQGTLHSFGGHPVLRPVPPIGPSDGKHHADVGCLRRHQCGGLCNLPRAGGQRRHQLHDAGQQHYHSDRVQSHRQPHLFLLRHRLRCAVPGEPSLQCHFRHSPAGFRHEHRGSLQHSSPLGPHRRPDRHGWPTPHLHRHGHGHRRPRPDPDLQSRRRGARRGRHQSRERRVHVDPQSGPRRHLDFRDRSSHRQRCARVGGQPDHLHHCHARPSVQHAPAAGRHGQQDRDGRPTPHLYRYGHGYGHPRPNADLQSRARRTCRGRP